MRQKPDMSDRMIPTPDPESSQRSTAGADCAQVCGGESRRIGVPSPATCLAFVVACVCSFLAGHGLRPAEPEFPWESIDFPVSQAEAVQTALSGLKDADIDISMHYIRSMDFRGRDHQWVIWLCYADAVLGLDFAVEVDAKTGRAVYIGHHGGEFELNPGRPVPKAGSAYRPPPGSEYVQP